ncbi:unnamed protein product [Paramecium sonneborni]|uniref:Uncharacterized protein n=1 Tax=Paramecium sonneborni TaxID=65129 RepID=A0A8S1RK02_9CILI|nr:unnamed protein product [Paramecium sonneborni]
MNDKVSYIQQKILLYQIQRIYRKLFISPELKHLNYLVNKNNIMNNEWKLQQKRMRRFNENRKIINLKKSKYQSYQEQEELKVKNLEILVV